MFAEVDAELEELIEGTTAVGRWGAADEEEEDTGTCWKARVISLADIRGQGPGPDGGGVPPSSDLTSCRENGTPVRSSTIPFNELMGWP